MRFITVFSLLVVVFVCLTVAQVSYDDCCLKYVRKMGRTIQKFTVSYTQQVADGGCNIPAIIFKMRKGRIYCTNPNEQWVIDLMKRIDGKGKSKSRKLHHKG